MNTTLENVPNNERSSIFELLRKPFKQRQSYEELTRNALEELSYTKEKELAQRNVFPLLKVLPIRLNKSDNKRSDMFHSLKQYCRTDKHKNYGEDWPTELADSMGLDSLLDWDFDTDIHEDTGGSAKTNYKPTETLIITERTIAVQGYQHILTTDFKIIDTIVIPNQNQTNKNDTCLVCLSTGEVLSLDFCYAWEPAIFNIECVCTGGNMDQLNSELDARFLYSSEDDTVLLVTSMHVLCVLALHKRERAFFKPEFNVLLQLGCDFETSTWQAGKLLYMVNKEADVRSCVLIEQDILRFGPFKETLTINDVHDNDKIIILEKDNVLQLSSVSKMGCIVSGGSQRTSVGALNLKFSKEIDVHMHNFERIFNEPIKKAHILVLENSIIMLCMTTDSSSKILSFVVTRLPIPIDDISIEQVDVTDQTTFLVVSRAEVYRYTVDFHEAVTKEMTSENIASMMQEMLLANVTNVYKITEGYENIESVFRFHDSVVLQSKNKMYQLPREHNKPLVYMDQLTFFTEFQAFYEVKVIRLKQQEGNGASFVQNKFGSIPIRYEDPQVEQYILVGLSFLCSAEAYYVEIVNNEQVVLQIIDDLLPETEEPMIEFGIIEGNFISITETTVHVNDFEAVKSHTLPFRLARARVTKESGIVAWRDDHCQDQYQDQNQAKVYSIDWETGSHTETQDLQGTEQNDIIDVIKFDSPALTVDWVKSTITGKIIVGSDKNGTTREIDTGSPMKLARLMGPWIMFYNATTVNVLNVLEGQPTCCLDHLDSLIVEVTCYTCSNEATDYTHVFTLHDNGLAINKIRVNEPHGQHLAQDWSGMEWTIEMPSDMRIVCNKDMSKMAYIDRDNGVLKVENRQKPELPGEIVGYTIPDDEAQHLCVFSYEQDTLCLWADLFKRGSNTTLQWISRIKALEGTKIVAFGSQSRLFGETTETTGASQFLTVVLENGTAEVLHSSLQLDSPEEKLAAEKRLSIPIPTREREAGSFEFFQRGNYIIRVTLDKSRDKNSQGATTSISSTPTDPDRAITIYSTVPCGTTMRRKESGDFHQSDSF